MAFNSRTWVPAGHFYSPLVDPSEPAVREIVEHHFDLDLPADESLALNDNDLLNTFAKIRSAYGLIEFPEKQLQGFRYYYDNPAFSYGDAVTYFGLLHSFRPERVIEIGSGFSSCLLMDTNDRLFGGKITPAFIDPYPEVLLSLIPGDDPYRRFIVAKRVQEMETGIFRDLRENDILFIDSSHVLKMGSDVNDYLFRIFPALRSGVLIHIHDIFYPFEYGPAWILEENRSWNEAYAIRAFLQYNNRFKVIYFNHYMYRKHRELMKLVPLCLRNCGGSLWLQKK